jgi:hypothetical protein
LRRFPNSSSNAFIQIATEVGMLAMIICADTKTETWSPDFSSSGSRNPTWTRVRVNNTVLINTLEWTDWSRNPVQIVVCDACGTVSCASGGYVHVSRLDNFVLLTAPQIDADDDWESTQYAAHFVLENFGAVAIPNSIWATWQARIPELPEPLSFAESNGRALVEAWALGPGRPKRVETLPTMLKHRLLACDRLAPDVAVRHVQHWLDYFLSRSGVPIPAKVVPRSELGLTIETLYFDGPSNEDWPALAFRNETDYIALDSEHVLMTVES